MPREEQSNVSMTMIPAAQVKGKVHFGIITMRTDELTLLLP